MANDRHRERLQDQTVEDSFPASDPPAQSGVIGPCGAGDMHSRGAPDRSRSDDATPKGRPTSARHAAETAHVREDESEPGRHD